MMTTQPGGNRAAGFTLLEIAMATTLVAMITGTIWTLVIKSQSLFEDQVQLYNIDDAGLRVLSRLSEELHMVSPASVLPAVLDDSETISFRRAIGWDEGKLEVGPVYTIALEKALATGKTVVGKNLTLKASDGSFILLAEDILDLRFNSTGNGIRFQVEVGIENNEGVLLKRTFEERITFRMSQ